MEVVLFIRLSLNGKENNGVGWQSFEQISDFSLIAEKSLIKKSYIYIILLAMISPFYLDNDSLLVYASISAVSIILIHLMAVITMCCKEPPANKDNDCREKVSDILNSMVLTSGVIYSSILSIYSVVTVFEQAGTGHINSYGVMHIMLSISLVSIFFYLVEIIGKSDAMLMARRYLKPVDSSYVDELKRNGCKDTVEYINNIGNRPLLSGECVLLLNNQSGKAARKKELIIEVDWFSGSLVESIKALPFK